MGKQNTSRTIVLKMINKFKQSQDIRDDILGTVVKPVYCTVDITDGGELSIGYKTSYYTKDNLMVVMTNLGLNTDPYKKAKAIAVFMHNDKETKKIASQPIAYF